MQEDKPNNNMINLRKCFLRWKEVILITLIIRSLLFLFSFIYTKNLGNFLRIWNGGGDGLWYLDIAQNWYRTSGEYYITIVFYPLYPLLVKLTSFFVPNFILAAILLSTFFSFIASIALFELVLLDFSKRAAILSVWFLNIFPTSYFLQATYTESLFLTISILTVYFFRKKQDKAAVLVGLSSALTRINGLTLLPILFLEKKTNKQFLVTLIMIISGFFIYLGINFFLFGDPFYFTKPLSENWGKRLEWPWVGFFYLLGSDLSINSYTYLSELIALLLIIFSGIYTFLKLRKSYGIYILINLLLITSTNFILSTPRYALILFPIFIAMGTIKSTKIVILSSIISIMLLLFLTTLFIQGKWAF